MEQESPAREILVGTAGEAWQVVRLVPMDISRRFVRDWEALQLTTIRSITFIVNQVLEVVIITPKSILELDDHVVPVTTAVLALAWPNLLEASLLIESNQPLSAK